MEGTYKLGKLYQLPNIGPVPFVVELIDADMSDDYGRVSCTVQGRTWYANCKLSELQPIRKGGA